MRTAIHSAKLVIPLMVLGLVMGQGCPMFDLPQQSDSPSDQSDDNSTSNEPSPADGDSSTAAPLVASINADPEEIEAGGSSQLTTSVSGGTPPYAYSWSPATGLSSTKTANPTATPSTTQEYVLTVSDAAGESVQAGVTVTVGQSSEDDERGMGAVLVPADEYAAIPLSDEPASGELPEAVDLSANMPTPGNQQQQKSCTAWAVGYSLKSYQERVERKWDLGDDSHLFSPAFLYNQIRQGNCGGGISIPDALYILKRQGCAPFSLMPYEQTDCATVPNDAQRKAATPYQIAFARRVNFSDLAVIKAHLAAGDPVVVAIAIHTVYYERRGSQATVYDTVDGKVKSGHAVVAVGYDDNRQRVKLINSWGTRWGEGGYFYIPYTIWPQIVREAYVAKDQVAGDLEVSASATPEEVFPEGSSHLSAGVAGGVEPFTYQWTPAETISDPSSADPLAKPSDTTTYTVTVTDGAGRQATAEVVVRVTALALRVEANAQPEAIIAGQSSRLTALASGGIPPYQYRWAPASSLSDSTAVDPLATPETSTTYAVFVTDSVGHEATAQVAVAVTEQTQPLQASAGSDQAVTVGSTIRLQGTASGGTGSYMWSWSPATDLSSTTVANPRVSTASPFTRTYTLTVTSGDQTISDQVVITVKSVVQPPAAPNHLDAIGSSNKVVMSWTDNSSNEDGFRIERKVGSGSWAFLDNTGAGENAYEDTGLSYGKTYWYRVYAYNSGGTSSSSNEDTGVTLASPALDEPNNGTTIASFPITLEWDDVTGAEAYGIDLGTGSCGSTSVLNNRAAGSSTTYTINSLPNGTYYWRVRAANTTQGGLSAASGCRSFTVNLVAKPSAPSGLVAIGLAKTVVMSWTDNSSNEDGFRIERKVGSGSWAFLDNTGAGENAYEDTGLSYGKTYWYRVYAYNSGGTSDSSNQDAAVTLASPSLSAPSNGTTITSLPITLEWDDVTGAEAYGIDLGTGSCGSTSVLNNRAAGSSTTYTINSLPNGTYYWRVRAANTTQGGLSDASGCRSFTVNVASTPNAPTSLTAVGLTGGINLSWADNSNNETGFRIERKTTGSWSEIGTTSANMYVYWDQGRTAGVRYYYRVRAYNSAGTSAYSSTVSAVPQ